MPKIKTIDFFGKFKILLSDTSKTITNYLKKQEMTEIAQMENYFLSHPEQFVEYDPENEKYRAAREMAKEKYIKFPKIKV